MPNTIDSSNSWTPKRLAIFRLALSSGIGPCRYAQLLAQFGEPVAALAGLADMRRKDVRVASLKDAEAAITKAAKAGADILLRGDDLYPFRLAETARPPLALYTMGDQAILNRQMVGIVGARNASAAAKHYIEDLARDLSKAGIAVVSGLARGIDAAAHRGSLDGTPVGVVAGGIDIVYPPENADLQASIAANGVLVAESPIGAKPTDRHFPRRNRIVAGLASGVVVIEAAERSGSLITARFALEENREVMAVPGFHGDPRSRGANRLIQEGATMVQSDDDVLTVLHTPQPEPMIRPVKAKHQKTKTSTPHTPTPPTQDAESAISDPKDRLLSALGAAPVTVDEQARECQLEASAAAAILLDLELDGAVERLPGQRVMLR